MTAAPTTPAPTHEAQALQLLQERVGLWVAKNDPLYSSFLLLVERGQADAGASERNGTTFYYREPEQPYAIGLILWPDGRLTRLEERREAHLDSAQDEPRAPVEVLTLFVQVIGMPRLSTISVYTGFLGFPAIIQDGDDACRIDATRPISVLAPDQQSQLAQWMQETSWEAWGRTRWELRAQLGVDEPMVNITNIATHLGVTYTTVSRYIQRGKLPVIELGSYTYAYKSTAETALAQGMIALPLSGGVSEDQPRQEQAEDEQAEDEQAAQIGGEGQHYPST